MTAIKTKHTPGPWQVTNTLSVWSSGKNIRMIASCAAHELNAQSDEEKANAVLIAQAPDLLAERDRLRQVNAELVAALEWIVKSLTLAGDPELACQEYQLGIARAALAKAKGE